MKKDFLRLRVPESEKTKEWYKWQHDRIVPAGNSLIISDFDEMKRIYEFCNNDWSSFNSEISHYCGNLTDYGAAPEELVPYNPIPQKLSVLEGELLQMGNNHRIALLTSTALKHKNKELLALIQKSVNEELRLEIEKQKEMLQGKSEEEVNQYIEQLRTEVSPRDINVKDFKAESEIMFNKLLQYTYYEQQVQSKKVETFQHAVKVARPFIYDGWKYGRPHLQVLNPLFVGFQKNPNEPFIQKGDYVFYRDEITVADVIQEYQNRLSDKQLNNIIEHANSGNPIDKRHITEPVLDNIQYLTNRLLDNRYTNMRGIGNHQGNQQSNFNWDQTIWRTHLEFKAFKKVIFYSFFDEDGDKITVMLDAKTDVIPEDLEPLDFTNTFGDPSKIYKWSDEFGEYEAEVIWVPRRYEVTKLGEDEYVDFREVPFQPDNLHAPFSKFELSYKGCILNNQNAEFTSLVMLGMPHAFQLAAVENLFDKEVAAYRGQETVVDVRQIPEELALDHEGNPLEGADKVFQQEIIAQKTKTRLIDSMGGVIDGALVPSTRGQAVQHQVIDTSPQLMNLKQIAMVIDQKVGFSMGISPQREAQMTSNNVSDNRQALLQSSLSTQMLFYLHDQVWQHALSEHLYNLKVWLKRLFQNNPNMKEHPLHYILPDGKAEVLMVTPEALEKMEDIGLYVENTSKHKMYFDTMLQIQNIQAFAQNPESIEKVSALMKELVSTNSVEEVHKNLKLITAEHRQQMQQQHQMEMEAIEKQAEKQRENLTYQNELLLMKDLKILQMKQELDIVKAQIDSTKFQKQMDVNANNISDQYEIKEMELAHESSENAKDRQLEEKIAKMKNNSGKS